MKASQNSETECKEVQKYQTMEYNTACLANTKYPLKQ